MSKNHIEILETSNSNIVKFTANSLLTSSTSYEFKNIDEATPSPLAQQLFYLPFVKTVFISHNFIAIEKYDIIDWKDVQDEVAASILAYLNAGTPVITETTTATSRKLPVTIYAEVTPNPSVMKFVASKSLSKEILEFKDVAETNTSPLAKELFKFPFVKEVFISSNYISVMKYNMIGWEEISMEIREFIKKYIEDGKPIVVDAANSVENKTINNDSINEPTRAYSALEKEIINILDEYVKPAVAKDGGNILFKSFNESTKTVEVVLQGACSGCPSSTMTLKNGIEAMLKELLKGQVKTVEAING
ncbi:NifU family protein [Aequorivita marina]|uniref:NifU family protein n=1 Tax=Aequorivita marina TaxID=3073654 RepID=UPI0028749049|nr:NifU family protein [Aequorivita sp. S2608]MDS1299656.1 NifU family protein [Aequorivita sp. S2608]